MALKWIITKVQNPEHQDPQNLWLSCTQHHIQKVIILYEVGTLIVATIYLQLIQN